MVRCRSRPIIRKRCRAVASTKSPATRCQAARPHDPFQSILTDNRDIFLALEGHSAPAIAQTLARSRRFVQQWVYVYRDHGLEAICPKPQSGRPSELPVTQQEPFKERFLAGPVQADGVCSLRAKEAQRILQEEFGVEYTLATPSK